ncbi:fused response regulator/phosphatase [Streptomyces sp. HUAS MG91]|uniref:Fused response regulator/phosphatase n=1 Tax=Streptomyces tabacisoli TaxID=3156398 RepID=A0AAU8J0I7_9ACTN
MTHSVSDGGPALVLIVDDNPINRYVLGTTLRRAGHEILEAEDGTQALEVLQHTPRVPDAAIIDVQLPDMTGFEVCERVKASPRTAGVPVLHISATAVSVDDRTQGLNRGADAYLTEPVAPDELIATLAATLRYTRARRRAETLAERLHQLHRTTLALYSAPDAQQLADAAAFGAAAVLDRPAVVRLTASDGTVYTRRAPDAAALEPQALDTVAAALQGSGVHVMPYESPGDGRRHLLAAARTKSGRPPTCIAVPVAERHAATDGEEQDAELLAQVTHTTALALETLRTYSEEHTLALTLQRSFLPEKLPATPRARLAVRYLPASEHAEIGGDFYEALTTPSGLMVAVGDVAGHSLEAAMVMGQIRHGLRAYALEGHPPHVVLERLDMLLRTVARGATLTLCIMLLEEAAPVLHIANAGHLPPLLLRGDADETYLRDHGPLLGLGLPQPPATRVTVTEGDVLMMITDGLVERRDEDIDTSLSRLSAIAVKGPRAPENMCEHLLRNLPPDGRDDIALMVVSVGPTAPRE